MPSHLGPLGGRTFAAVLFDMDGTLIDSIPVVIRSWLRWAEEHGLEPSALQGFHGVPAAAIVARLLPEGRHELALQRITELELADTDGITVLPGAARGPGRAVPGPLRHRDLLHHARSQPCASRRRGCGCRACS